MPPKKAPAPSKKVEQKKKEKVIEVSENSVNQQIWSLNHMFYFLFCMNSYNIYLNHSFPS